jgi:HD-GYP domain-containing protein (c-di-GMP phosphodiesterase class II)
MKGQKMKPQYRIALIYLIVGVFWIFLSDVAANSLFDQKEDIAIAQNIKGWVFVTITTILLFLLIRKDIHHITNSYHQTISGWVHVMDLRHKETKNHSIRVTNMALELAKLSGISDKKKLEDIKRGAILHDIGKIGIPDAILVKPGSLDTKEWEIMKTHPQIAHDLLMEIDFLSPCIAIPYCHHERWDGSGYPQGLKADAIPIEARIFAVVDVWDALIHPRVYKPAWSEEEVLQHIQEQAGRHFDPTIVKLFLENYEEIKCHAKAGDFITSPV